MLTNVWQKFITSYREDSKGWLICIAVLIVTVVRSGITYSFGVFVVALVKKYHTPLTEQNWIGTLSFTVSLSCAPLSVTLIRWLNRERYRLTCLLGVILISISCLCSSFAQNSETLFFTHSLLYGVGSSLTYMGSSLIIGEYFDKNHRHHVLATSILLCGYPLGSLIFNPVNSYIIESTNWKVAFRIAAGIVFFVGSVCCFPFQRKPNVSDSAIDDKDYKILPLIPLSELRQKPEIILWLFAALFTYLGFYMPFVNLEYYMHLKHISQHQSGWALFLLSLAECISYISGSFCGDHLKGRLIYVNLVAAVALAIICVIWPSVDTSYASIMATCCAMGFFLGLTIVYTYAESGEITQLHLDIAWAYTNMFSGVGILLSPLTSGFVYDLRKSYDDVFYTVAGVYTILAILIVLIIVIKKLYLPREFDYDEITPSQKEYQQTFRITKRSISSASDRSKIEEIQQQTGDSKEINPSYQQDYGYDAPVNTNTGGRYQQTIMNQFSQDDVYESYNQGPITLEQLPRKISLQNTSERSFSVAMNGDISMMKR